MSRGKGTVTQKARLHAGEELCEGLHPKTNKPCREYVTTTRTVDGIEYALCRVHADAVDHMERRRKLAAQ